jgi:hypothetical protein
MQSARRFFLRRFASAITLLVTTPIWLQQAMALGLRQERKGFQKLKGTVLLNGKPAMQGELIKTGDLISTGDNSETIFVIDRNAFLLHSNTQLKLSESSTAHKIYTLLSGKMLSVFSKSEKTIKLPTATIGVRGTALYAEADPLTSYLCLCYGDALIVANNNPAEQETIATKHHDTPRYLHSSGDKLITPAPVMNHTDDEIFMLEALVGRLPEFYGTFNDDVQY